MPKGSDTQLGESISLGAAVLRGPVGSVCLGHSCPFGWGGSFFGFVGVFCEIKAHCVFFLKKKTLPIGSFVNRGRDYWEGLALALCGRVVTILQWPGVTACELLADTVARKGAQISAKSLPEPKLLQFTSWPSRKMWIFLFPSQEGKPPATVSGNSTGNLFSAGHLLFTGALASSESMGKMLWASLSECLHLMGPSLYLTQLQDQASKCMCYELGATSRERSWHPVITVSWVYRWCDEVF